MKIGILAVQGAFLEHRLTLEQLGCDCVELRKKEDLCTLDGLVLPGGESTVQGKLLRELGMFDPLQTMIRDGIPTLATCAGLILLAEHISNDPAVWFGTLPVTVRRNAYGRQLGSFRRESDFAGLGKIPMTFIRAPYIESVGEGASVLAEVDGKITAAQYGKQIGLSFHPELDDDRTVHRYFISAVESR